MNEYAASGGGKILYFDCYSGISGDMVLGALLDLGLDLESLQKMLTGLNLSGFSLEVERVTRGGIAGSRAVVNLEENSKVERHLSDILKIIKSSDLPDQVKDNSESVFRSLAEAEAAVHGISVERVHFHEVGALDAIVDIVGSVCALYLLGVDTIVSSSLPLGRGEVMTAHGRLPLPAPATLELIAKQQAPVSGRDVAFELVTPTGAALIVTLAGSFGRLPDFNIDAVGYGAGSHDPGYPNFLRLIYGFRDADAVAYEEEACLIETNIDDLNPEIFGYLMEKLFAAGAQDVYFTPIQMKKNRPSVQLTVLSPPFLVSKLQAVIFNETTTLGLRVSSVRKVMQQRDIITVETKWGPIRIKYTPGMDNRMSLNFAPEYEDCIAVASKSGLPLKEVYRLAEHLFRNLY
ncbi:MAG: nickel pincer cofactor biosynthesis protein LarC [Dethiobacteria bacterium]